MSKKISETLNNLRGRCVKAKACTAQTGGGAAGSTMPRDPEEASDDDDDADQQGRKYVWAEVVTTNTGLPGKVVEDPEVNDEGLIELAVELNEMAHSLFASRAEARRNSLIRERRAALTIDECIFVPVAHNMRRHDNAHMRAINYANHVGKLAARECRLNSSFRRCSIHWHGQMLPPQTADNCLSYAAHARGNRA